MKHLFTAVCVLSSNVKISSSLHSFKTITAERRVTALSGSEFQTVGPATEKARRLTGLSRRRGTVR